MKTAPLLSIIIPVYNTEKFLRKCLDSVLEQSYENIEVVVVNDCSPDDSEKVITEYMQKDARIKYVKNDTNMGLFQTRINGFKHSKGEYIATLDSDDTVGVDYYRLLMKDAVGKQADITVSSVVIAVCKDEKEADRNQNYRLRTMADMGMRNIVLNGKEILNSFLETECYTSHWWIGCCKVYRRRIWEKALPTLEKLDSNLTMLEDLTFGVIFMSLAEKYISSDSETYFYLKHPDSSSMDNGNYNKFEKNIRDIATALLFLENYLKERKVDIKKINKFSNMRKIMRRTWGSMVRESNFNRVEKSNLYQLLDLVSTEETSDIPTTEDKYCYLLDTPWDARYNELKKDIQKSKYKYISFDIFDTLVVRPFFKPADLFQFLNYEYNNLVSEQTFIDFAAIRVEAERNVRRKLKMKYPHFEEVTLDEIYEELCVTYGLDKEILNKLKNSEVEMEIKYCYAREKVNELYEFAFACGKKIICISDMYLDSYTIREILKKCGYHHIDTVFVSSEYRITKRTGSLYQKVLEELDAEPEEILHIGDNWDCDIVVPREMGISCWLTPKTTELLENRIPDIDKEKKRARFYSVLNQNQSGNYINFQTAFQHMGIRTMLAVIANKYFSNPYRSYSPNTDFNRDPYYMGYFALGMHDFGIAMWLKEHMEQKKYKKIHFVARDGYVVKKVYDILRTHYPYLPESNYFYMSRKSLLSLSITAKESFFSLERYMKVEGNTIRNILDLLAPIMRETDNLEEIYKEHGLFIDKALEKETVMPALKAISEISFDEGKMYAFRNSMKKYFQGIVKPHEAMFDIGYSGRAQALLSGLLGYPIDAFYIHSINDSDSLYHQQGEFSMHTFFDYTPAVIGRMRELIQSEVAGSCVGYKIENGEVKGPVFETVNFSYPAKMVMNLMHQGAIDFVNDLINIFGADIEKLPYRYSDTAFAHEFFLHNPTHGDIQVFRIFYFEDDMFMGKDYIKKDMATLWQNDLERKNLFIKPKVITKTLVKTENKTIEKNVPVHILEEMPDNSIPITSDKIDLEHITNKQLGQYYYAFDRRRFDRWLEEQCRGPLKHFFVYGTYRQMKAIRNKLKHRKVLYVATSQYNILCCLIHKEKYYAHRSATLLLSDWRSGFKEKIEETGIFSEVKIQPDVSLREKAKQIGYGFHLLNDEQKEATAQKFLKCYGEALPVDIFEYGEIIVCNDTMPLGSYLCANKVKYQYIEEGSGLFSDNTLLRENIELHTPRIERYLITKYDILNHSKYAKKFYINYDAQTNKKHLKHTKDFNVVRLLKSNSDEKINKILRIFGGTYEKECSGEENAALLLTYPLAQRLENVSFEQQYEVYAKIADIFMEGKVLHIKPHPDDKGEYEKYFPNARIIPKTILSELLWYETKTIYDIAVCAVSTSMGALDCYKEGKVLSREFVESNHQLFLYYIIALLCKSIQKDNSTLRQNIQKEIKPEILRTLMTSNIFGQDICNFICEKDVKTISVGGATDKNYAAQINITTAPSQICRNYELKVNVQENSVQRKDKEVFKIKIVTDGIADLQCDELVMSNSNVVIKMELSDKKGGGIGYEDDRDNSGKI